MPETFHFELVSPERLLIAEAVRSVVVPGSEGDFTVLPRHAPVLADVRPGVVDVINDQGEEQRIYVRGGFAEVGPESLTLLAEHAVDLAELDLDRLAQDIRNVEEDVADAKDEQTRDKAERTLANLKSLQDSLKQL